jgi:predicted RNA-binding protein YlqC (UPF0109 family)
MAAPQLTAAQARAVELVSYLAVHLVDHPDAVRVDLVRGDGDEILRLRVHPDDQGQLIGKNGQTARALRSLLSAVGARSDERFILEIADEA